MTGATDPWTAAMRAGDYAAAWRLCDAVLAQRRRERIDCGRWPRHLQFLWDGTPPDGRRVLVHCYHGLGDTLQFVRFLPALRARAARVTLWVQPALLELLRGCEGVDRLAALHDRAPDLERDLDVESMELAHVLRVGPQDLPGPVPYLHVPGAGRRPAGDPALRVGLAWRAGDWNPARSLPVAALAGLATVPGVRWHSVQYGDAAPRFARDLACRNLVAQARCLQTLDLVISVDTMTAHLSGALGLPVWTLLPHAADWRWGERRDDSPWYPTMRLFRQPRAGAGDAALERVGDALGALAVATERRGRGGEFTIGDARRS